LHNDHRHGKRGRAERFTPVARNLAFLFPRATLPWNWADNLEMRQFRAAEAWAGGGGAVAIAIAVAVAWAA
jgi:hypothetical protein